MKILYFLLLAVCCTTTGFAQQTLPVGSHQVPANWTPNTTYNFASASDARLYAQQIVTVVGLKANFEMMPARIDNAAAVTYGGRRYVLYNPDFINALVRTTGNKWAAVSVLAHEIGHHLNGHTVTRSGSHPATELEADEFSGFVLRKMGASLADAQAAMQLLASSTASPTHPARQDRLAYIAKGWHNAGGGNMRDVAVQPRPAPGHEPAYRQAPVHRTPVMATRSIIGTVRFDASPNSRYFITDSYEVVQVQNQEARTIAQLARMNDTRFPYVIYDERNTKLIVSHTGAIYTTSGRQVGTLRAYNG